MALYRTPDITAERREKLAAIAEARVSLGGRVVESEKWAKLIRRSSQAAAYASSTAIEGFSTTPERAVELLGDAQPVNEDDLAFTGYARAMQHVGVVAAERDFEWSRRLLLDLHFDLCSFEKKNGPGALRDGPVYVTGPRGAIAFTGPPAAEVPGLIDELVAELNQSEGPPLVAAAMAHLNLVSIHPFADGNGRIARVLQSLVIARAGETAPELGSIEEYLASNTTAYYAALASAQAGELSPARPADEWVDFCLDAHLVQAAQRQELVAAAADRWAKLEREVESRDWPDRMVIALERALAGNLTRAGYARESGIAEITASLDLRRLVDTGLVDMTGGGRSTAYVAAPPLNRLV